MFRKVELQTMAGELVHRGWIPHYKNGYPVLLWWGTRTFLVDGLQAEPVAGSPAFPRAVTLFRGGVVFTDLDQEVLVYREAFCTALVPLSAGVHPDGLPEWEGTGP